MVFKAEKEITCSTGCGSHGIPSRVIEHCVDTLAPPLARLFNLSMATEVFPICWKQTRTTTRILLLGHYSRRSESRRCLHLGDFRFRIPFGDKHMKTYKIFRRKRSVLVCCITRKWKINVCLPTERKIGYMTFKPGTVILKSSVF